MRNDTRTQYGTISRAFHWGMGVLILWQLLKLGDRIAEGEHWIGETLVPWHISIGSLLLVLVALRIIWALRQRGHRPLPPSGRELLVRSGHVLLYALMVAMPVSGALYMVGSGYGINAFGVQLIAKGDPIPWAKSIGSLHSPIAWLLLVTAAGHAAIAFFHHFVKKDDVLRRML